MLWITSAFCMLLTNPLVAADLEPGKQVPRSAVLQIDDEKGSSSLQLHYLLFVPQNFDGEQKMPLLLFLHGVGERGNELEKVKKWGPPRIVEEKPDFPFIVVSPQCPRGKRWDAPVLLKILDLDSFCVFQCSKSMMECIWKES